MRQKLLPRTGIISTAFPHDSEPATASDDRMISRGWRRPQHPRAPHTLPYIRTFDIEKISRMAPTRRRTSAVVGLAATAGLCFLPSKQLRCHAFSSSTARSSSSKPVGVRCRGVAGIASMVTVRPRHSSIRVCSTVEDVEKQVDGDKSGISGNNYEV